MSVFIVSKLTDKFCDILAAFDSKEKAFRYAMLEVNRNNESWDNIKIHDIPVDDSVKDMLMVVLHLETPIASFRDEDHALDYVIRHAKKHEIPRDEFLIRETRLNRPMLG